MSTHHEHCAHHGHHHEHGHQHHHAPAASAMAEVPAGTKYTCPMHPQIVRDEPGSCPICGMALEPVMPSLEEGEHPELVDFRRRFWWTLPLSILALGAVDREPQPQHVDADRHRRRRRLPV